MCERIGELKRWKAPEQFCSIMYNIIVLGNYKKTVLNFVNNKKIIKILLYITYFVLKIEYKLET